MLTTHNNNVYHLKSKFNYTGVTCNKYVRKYYR